MSETRLLRIGTRASRLALWQAEHVAALLQEAHPGLTVELVKIISEGDKTLDVPLSQVGGKGLFLKELESALLDQQIDLAVHSMKDVTVLLPAGLTIATITERGDPCDAFVSNKYERLDELPENAVVGTCSLRRQCFLRHNYPHLEIRNLRGNLDTRLGKLDAGEYDAIILAAVGLSRLKMASRIKQRLDIDHCLPAVAQGALGIEVREDDADTLALLAPLQHMDSWYQVMAERTVNAALNGGCHTPVAIHATRQGDRLALRAWVGQVDGSEVLHASGEGVQTDFASIGQAVADQLIAQGALDILQAVYAQGEA